MISVKDATESHMLVKNVKKKSYLGLQRSIKFKTFTNNVNVIH